MFLNAFEFGGEARVGIGRWIGYSNEETPHSAIGNEAMIELIHRSVADGPP